MRWLWLLVAVLEVAEVGRFPFQQPASRGAEPPPNQVGQLRTAWQQYAMTQPGNSSYLT